MRGKTALARTIFEICPGETHRGTLRPLDFQDGFLNGAVPGLSAVADLPSMRVTWRAPTVGSWGVRTRPLFSLRLGCCSPRPHSRVGAICYIDVNSVCSVARANKYCEQVKPKSRSFCRKAASGSQLSLSLKFVISLTLLTISSLRATGRRHGSILFTAPCLALLHREAGSQRSCREFAFDDGEICFYFGSLTKDLPRKVSARNLAISHPN